MIIGLQEFRTSRNKSVSAKLFDRGYPNYDYPASSTDDSVTNYIRFVRSIEKRGTKIEKFSAGSSHQIALQHSQTDFLNSSVRNLAANGEVWTGHDENTQKLFPPLDTLKPEQYPTENSCSIAMRFDYGAFCYYIGGDLTCDTRFGTAPWLDVETPVAKAAGPANVSALNHHGYFDSTGPDFVRQMRSRIYVVQAWHASHPALSVLDRLVQSDSLSRRSRCSRDRSNSSRKSGRRKIFRQNVKPARSCGRACFGKGRQYQVIVLDDSKEDGEITKRFGPYTT